MNERILKKLAILADSAKYDASCASSGVDRKGKSHGGVGSAASMGVCHSFTEDGRCVSLLKVLYTNHCVYDCAYCVNRRSNDVPRTSFSVNELVELTIEFYRRNYIEGLFLSSGIVGGPDHTMERLARAVQLLRTRHRFNGYIHLKAIPGADSALIRLAGRYADRLSVNVEIPVEADLRRLAPEKDRPGIYTPMRTIREGILEYQEERRHKRAGVAHLEKRAVPLSESRARPLPPAPALPAADASSCAPRHRQAPPCRPRPVTSFPSGPPSGGPPPFAPAGQSTQMIVGAGNERDHDILRLSSLLYRGLELKRVYYSAFIPVNAHDSRLPALAAPPLLREHRLYQADWLMRLYAFDAGEICDSLQPDLDLEIDPKLAWALRHPEFFPLDLARAEYERILRVPGIGIRSAKTILAARRHRTLTLDHLKKMGVAVNRARFFLTTPGSPAFTIQEAGPAYVRSMLTTPKQLLPPFIFSPSPRCAAF